MWVSTVLIKRLGSRLDYSPTFWVARQKRLRNTGLDPRLYHHRMTDESRKSRMTKPSFCQLSFRTSGARATAMPPSR